MGVRSWGTWGREGTLGEEWGRGGDPLISVWMVMGQAPAWHRALQHNPHPTTAWAPPLPAPPSRLCCLLAVLASGTCMCVFWAQAWDVEWTCE